MLGQWPMLAFCLSFLLALLPVLRANLTDSILFSPLSAREVGQQMTISWTFSAAAQDQPIKLQLISDRPDVLLEAMPLTDPDQPLSLKQASFTWTVPRFLKTSDSYQIQAVRSQDAQIIGTSPAFTLINPFPLSQSTLTVLEPSGAADGSSLEATCLLGETCLVRWDFPSWATSAVPKTLNLALYRANGEKVLDIAQGVPSTAKSFSWQVPNWPSLELPAAYVVVSGPEVKRAPGPGVAGYNAAGGFPFILESRAHRDARDQRTVSIDYLAPGPIRTEAYEVNSTNNTVTFLDVPRPTYAPVVGIKSSSDAGALRRGVSLFLGLSLVLMQQLM